MVRRLRAVALVTYVVVVAALPLGATTTTGADTGTVTTEAATETATTEATAPAVTIQPAVPVDTAPEPQTNPDWTYRFFIPTLLVLTVLVVIVTVIQYFTRVVRNRYRIVR